MEINPSTKGADAPLDLRPQWMYDQIEAESELDFVTALRHKHGDAYAIQTMKNHWEGYYTGPMLDAALVRAQGGSLCYTGPQPLQGGCALPRVVNPMRPYTELQPRVPMVGCRRLASTRCACPWATGSWTRPSAAARPSSTASAPRVSSRAG